MNGFVGNTDYDWYDFLRAQPDLDEVNFWQPSGGRAFRSLRPGEPFFFKLKRPHNAIGGFGLFARFSVLPAWLAWETFGPANGAPSFAEMSRRIEKYRRADRHDRAGQYMIGCILVAQPVFFPRGEGVEQPRDWKANIVPGTGYSLREGEGLRIWDECRVRSRPHLAVSPAEDERSRYGPPVLVAPRIGQGIFRVSVMDAYERACAVTNEHSLPALDAAHIKPYADEGTHRVSNGILLRSDVHKLFDRGYVTITPEFRFEVSRRLKEDFENGRSYYPLHGSEIRVPKAEAERPAVAELEWHNEQRYLG